MEKNKFILSLVLIVSAVFLGAIYIIKSKDLELKEKEVQIKEKDLEIERAKASAKKAEVEIERAKVDYKAKEVEGLVVSSSKSELKNVYVMCVQAVSLRTGVTNRDINELCSEMNLKKGYYHSSNK